MTWQRRWLRLTACLWYGTRKDLAPRSWLLALRPSFSPHSASVRAGGMLLRARATCRRSFIRISVATSTPRRTLQASPPRRAPIWRLGCDLRPLHESDNAHDLENVSNESITARPDLRLRRLRGVSSQSADFKGVEMVIAAFAATLVLTVLFAFVASWLSPNRRDRD